MNLQASQVLKIGMSAKYLIRTIGPLPYWCIFIVTSPQEINKTMQSNYVRMLRTSKTKFDSAGKFFCRYSRISIYISFTWVSKRGAPKVRKRHPCTTCPPMHNSEKWIFNLQASRVLKIENSMKYVIRTIGPWPYWCILIVTSSREIKKQCRTFVCT